MMSCGPEIGGMKLTEPFLCFVLVLQWFLGVDCNLHGKNPKCGSAFVVKISNNRCS